MKSRAIYGQFVKFKYESILEYNSFVEKNIEKAVSEIDAEYEEFVKNNPGVGESDDEEYDDHFLAVVDDMAYESQKLKNDILQYHRKSVLFHIYSVLERELHRIAQIVGQDSPFKMTDLKGNSPFEQFKAYVKKIEPDLLTDIRDDFNYFDNVRAVRNIITHNESIIRNDNSNYNKINDFSSGRFTMHLRGNNKTGKSVYEIQLDNQDFIREMFDKFESFTDKIYR